jgi:hypothetical protein
LFFTLRICPIGINPNPDLSNQIRAEQDNLSLITNPNTLLAVNKNRLLSVFSNPSLSLPV